MPWQILIVSGQAVPHFEIEGPASKLALEIPFSFSLAWGARQGVDQSLDHHCVREHAKSKPDRLALEPW